jgi:hypothetical protein
MEEGNDRRVLNIDKKNVTWDLIPPKSMINLIDSRWVYRVKRKADGSVERLKARLVAK